MLIFADRVNVFEDIFSDLASGRIPNFWKEMGLSAEWKYNRASFLKKLAFVGLSTAGIIAMMRMRRSTMNENTAVELG
jgi:hypothetical protein